MDSICGVSVEALRQLSLSIENNKATVIATFIADILEVSPVSVNGEPREFGLCFTDDDDYFDDEHNYSTSVRDYRATIWFLFKAYDPRWSVSFKCKYDIVELPYIEDDRYGLLRVFVIHPLPLDVKHLHDRYWVPDIEIEVEGKRDGVGYQELIGWFAGY